MRCGQWRRCSGPCTHYRSPCTPEGSGSRPPEPSCLLKVGGACSHKGPAPLRTCLIIRPARARAVRYQMGTGRIERVLRQSLRCTACGARGAAPQHPDWIDAIIGVKPFRHPARRLPRPHPCGGSLIRHETPPSPWMSPGGGALVPSTTQSKISDPRCQGWRRCWRPGFGLLARNSP
jgi:hypothetical protein